MRSKKHRLYVESLRKAGAYEQLVEEHGSETCWACGRKPGKRKLHIDHAHGPELYVRGLLDWRCNRILEESVTPELLRAMAEYLENAQERYARMLKSKRAA